MRGNRNSKDKSVSDEAMRLSERIDRLHYIVINLLCNVSIGLSGKDLEYIRIAYDTAQSELEESGFKRFLCAPNVEDGPTAG